MKKQQKLNKNSSLVIYQAKSGALELRGDALNETLWATQAQIAHAFDVDVRTVNEHIKNILKTKELSEQATIRKFRIVQEEGKRVVEREVNHYDLDMILSVGYRVNSKKATSFRQWATKTLRTHITDGYTINSTRVAKNYDTFMKAVGDVQDLLPAHVALDPKAVLELIKEFASTWVSLDAYDKEALQIKGVSKKRVSLVASELYTAIEQLKDELLTKGDATELFASERREGSIEGIVGNVMQSFGGTSVYPTVEEKAAHLLYFMVKNHPFTDGNKRSGAFAFIWFLKRTGARGSKNITPSALTALTLLVAESDPKRKGQMVALITNLIR
jgi:prophage maintenance system killer protein